MRIIKTSPVTKENNTMDLPITHAQLIEFTNGALVQNAFPNLNSDQREFLISGCTPQCWELLFPEEEEA